MLDRSEQIAAWLAGFREAGQKVLAAVRQAPIADRTHYVGIGPGGDDALVLDLRADDILFETIQGIQGQLGIDVAMVSEERGCVDLSDGSDVSLTGADLPDWVVIVDPLDGSDNVSHDVPHFGLSLALADGCDLTNVQLSVVVNVASHEEFWAVDGDGLKSSGPAAETIPGSSKLLVGLEYPTPTLLRSFHSNFPELAQPRIMGSSALAASYAAIGRFDAFIGGRGTRIFDIAAAALFLREAGVPHSIRRIQGGSDFDLESRFTVAVGRSRELLEQAQNVVDAEVDRN